MLVFTRKIDQAVVIGDGIEIRVLRLGRDSVRLGVTAAPEVSVHRGEVYDAIRRANAAAVLEAEALEAFVVRWRHHDRTR